MRNPHAGEPFTDSDAEIAAALQDVSIPALLMSCIHMTDDDAVRQAFNLNEDTSSHHVWLPKVVSRKKQIVPALALLWG